MPTKRCFKCGEVKDLAAFYRHPRMADGHLNKCQDCTKRDARTNYAARREYYVAYDRRRNRTPARRRRLDEYHARNPEKRRAHVAVSNALRRGTLTRQPCEVCGSELAQAHHEDYAKPLVVRWLCKPHHALADQARREREALEVAA